VYQTETNMPGRLKENMQEGRIGPLGIGKSFFVLAGSFAGDTPEEMMESRGFTEP
jgi:hypothetical protein